FLLADGDELSFGSSSLRVVATPGHTPDSNSFVVNGRQVFVGDVIFQPDVGSARVDFPGGSSEALYHSVTAKLFNLPADAAIFVGHDYPPVAAEATAAAAAAAASPIVDPLPTAAVLKPLEPAAAARPPQGYSTVAHQRAANRHFQRGHDDFKNWRDERDRALGQPKLLHASLQCNLRAGRLPSGPDGGFFKTPVRADFA
ncbi:Ethylmalonic encephalopathy 1, partial [Cladochytrium tenue]